MTISKTLDNEGLCRCGAEITSDNPRAYLCRDCFVKKKHADQYAPFIVKEPKALRALKGWASKRDWDNWENAGVLKDGGHPIINLRSGGVWTGGIIIKNHQLKRSVEIILDSEIRRKT